MGFQITLLTVITIMAQSTKCEQSNQEVFETLHEFCRHFTSPKSLSEYIKTTDKNEDDTFDPGISRGKRLFEISDLKDFSYYGKRDEDYLPHGPGELIDDVRLEDDEDGQKDVGSNTLCYRGVCSRRPLSSVWGRFEHGRLEGVATVTFRDRSRIVGQFRQSVLHGLSAEFDSLGRQRYISRYRNGKRTGLAWYFDPRCGTALYGSLHEDGSFSGNDFLYLLSSEQFELNVFKTKLQNGRIASSKSAKIEGSYKISDILTFETENKDIEVGLDIVKPVKLSPEAKDFEDIVFIQSTKLKLSLESRQNPFTAYIRNQNAKLEDIIDNSVQPIVKKDSLDKKCDISLIAIKEDFVNEVTLVSAFGSASNWLLSLLEFSTGIQNGGKTGLFRPTHHEKPLQKSTGKLRRRQPIDFRMANLARNGRGAAVLLLRNPYDAVVAHWTNRWAANGGAIAGSNDLQASLASQAFRDFAEVELKIWKDVAFDWLTVCPHLFVVHYENLVQDAVGELTKILEFIKFPIDGHKMRCIANRPTSYYRRLQESTTPSSIFSENFQDEADRAIEEIQMRLIDAGLDPGPLHLYEHTGIRTVTVGESLVNSPRK